MKKDKKLYKKFSNKKCNAKKENIRFLLSYEDFIGLMRDASITINDLNIKGYHLARYNDTGPYVIGNCRFVPYYVNLAEKKISEKSIRASRKNLQKYCESLTPEELSKRAKKGFKTKLLKGTMHIPDNKLDENEINKRIAIISTYNKNKRGWVTACSKEIGISHTQLRRFMKKQGMV